jgi:hypothetical protein
MIPLYALFTPSHRVLKENYFEPTLPPDIELHLCHVEIDGEGRFHDVSWRRAIVCKVEFILEAIERHAGTAESAFAFSDVDVQFFGSFGDWFERSLEQHDLVFQTDAPGPALCSGFLFCRANAVTRAFWQQVLAGVRASDGREDDQVMAQRLVWQMPELKWTCLPPIFFGGGTLTGRAWNPGTELPVPSGLLMHHANFTLGVPNKVRQLEYVREQVATR